MSSTRVHVNVLTPRVRVTDIHQGSQIGSDSEAEAGEDSLFHARHAVLERAERKANKSVYCTSQYRQAVDRARQRQKEEEKARDRLIPVSGPAAYVKAEDTEGCVAAEAEPTKRNTACRKRGRSGRASVDDQDMKRAQRQELCRRYLYKQSIMSADELEAARRAMVELRAEHNSLANPPHQTSRRSSPKLKKDIDGGLSWSKRRGDIEEQTIKQEKDLQDSSEVAFSRTTCKLMAKNIPQEIPIKAVRAHFSQYGDVANITLCFAKSSLGHAIITYTTPEAVQYAAHRCGAKIAAASE